MLNTSGVAIATDSSDFHTTIPISDSRIRNNEVTEVLEDQVKPDKGCGHDGSFLGVYKLLPGIWVTFQCFLFNAVFAGFYPKACSSAKLSMIFRKGLRSSCNNYRGISIINAVAKIYDYVLDNRLTTWYTPSREQSKNGCTEHIVTLLLLFDTFLRKRLKLSVVFVDFQKAYDHVPKSRLFDILTDLGCGITIRTALSAIYSSASSMIGSAWCSLKLANVTCSSSLLMY